MKCILGNVINNEMHLSEYGEIVENEFLKIPEYNKRIILDEWIVMPNHIHCIIVLCGYDYDNGVSDIGDDNDGQHVDKIHEFYLQRPTKPNPDEIKQYRKHRRNMIIPKLLGEFQMQTSKEMNNLRHTPGRKNWQRDYYDHVIRNCESYQRI